MAARCAESLERCKPLLERYFDPTEVLTSDEYLGLARCLLVAFRDCEVGFAAEYHA